jgi:hypothetical protein
MEIEVYKSFVRNHEYMSGISRDNHRVKQTAEVFTPTELVIEIIDDIQKCKPELFLDKTKTFIDNCCGDGQYLSEVIIKKIETSNCSLEDALATTYGVDIMQDNIIICKKRLAGPNPTQEILDILERNIVCADALKYHYRFDGTPPYTTEKELKVNQFFG